MTVLACTGSAPAAVRPVPVNDAAQLSHNPPVSLPSARRQVSRPTVAPGSSRAAASGPLPRTGADLRAIAAVGLAMFACGLGLRSRAVVARIRQP
jgi:hypothetical protein